MFIKIKNFEGKMLGENLGRFSTGGFSTLSHYNTHKHSVVHTHMHTHTYTHTHTHTHTHTLTRSRVHIMHNPLGRAHRLF